ncbi:RcnB family protein [Pseudomonas sp. SAICEU22]|uniref:RcnB family protein n=1 Tax=Pseudomonas agronomica TaxID=2979328 RepID=A0ABT3F621_9PSED|nr:RcnB family protein [Pseudomonas agronomica]MCW1244239.1 RcnB family protein [Pseudomonas agronomica]
MFKSRSLIAAVTCFALAAGPGMVVADPGNGKGNAQFDQGPGHGQGGKGGQGNKGGHGNKGNQGGNGGDWHNGPSIDRGGVLGVIGGYRDYWNPGPALPPGIQKNLARGKPLPPGIAKKLDGRLLGRLPHYDGYEWQQVGTDLILVAIASGIIYEVLNGAFD